MRTASSTPFNSSICITCFLMRSTAGATALLCSGETFRMPIRPSTTCSTSPFSPLLFSEEEEEEESEECAVPICSEGLRFFGPMFAVSTFFTTLFDARRPPEKSEINNTGEGTMRVSAGFCVRGGRGRSMRRMKGGG